MPGKPLDPKNLENDLRFILEGTVYHEAFYGVCPPRPGLKVLEPGCGSGKFGMAYALRGANVTLLDIDEGVLKYTEALFGLVFKSDAMRRVPFGGGDINIFLASTSIHDLERLLNTGQFGIDFKGFDFVFNEGVPHHWPREDMRRQGAIDQMAAVTKPGGKVAVMVSNAHCPAMMEYAATVDHTYEGMPVRQEPFTKEELYLTMVAAGLTGVIVRPVESVVLTRARTLLGWGTKP